MKRGLGLRGLVVGILVSLAASGCGSGSGPTAAASTTVTFRVAPGTSASARNRSARIMQARYRALGVRDARVVVGRRGLVAVGSPAVRTFADEVARPGVLTFRPVIALAPKGSGPNPSDVAAGQTVLAGAGPNDIEYVVAAPALTGGVRTATARYDAGTKQWSILLRFTPAGGKAFDQLAADSYQKPAPGNAVAIAFDDVVQSAPSFQQAQFPDGVSISGSFTRAEAEALATVLTTGPLPVAVHRV